MRKLSELRSGFRPGPLSFAIRLLRRRGNGEGTRRRADGGRRLVIVSDGQPTVGLLTDTQIAELVGQVHDDAITVTALAGEEPRLGLSARHLALVLSFAGDEALALRGRLTCQRAQAEAQDGAGPNPQIQEPPRPCSQHSPVPVFVPPGR